MEAFLISATYENGVLKPERPLPLTEHQRVEVAVRLLVQDGSCEESTVDPVRASFGMLGWKGDAETVERIAMDPEFGIHESS